MVDAAILTESIVYIAYVCSPLSTEIVALDGIESKQLWQMQPLHSIKSILHWQIELFLYQMTQSIQHWQLEPLQHQTTQSLFSTGRYSHSCIRWHRVYIALVDGSILALDGIESLNQTRRLRRTSLNLLHHKHRSSFVSADSQCL